MIEYFPRQQEALELLSNDSKVNQLLFGGSAGGSKSFIGCAWQVMRRLKYPGTRGLIGRSKLDTLKKTTLKTFFEVMRMIGDKPMIPGQHYNYNQQTNVITFYNGSEIILKDLFAYPSDPNFDSLGSLEITDYFIDEVSQVTQKAVSIVSSRVRFKLTEYGLQPKGLLTCNPSRGWLYNDFYKPWRDDNLPDYRAFLPALPGDNPHLPESYLDTLSRLPEQDRRRLRDGDWDYDEAIDRLYSVDDVLRCFRNELLSGEKYITADIARFGKDRTVIGLWDGLTLTKVEMLRRASVTEVAAKIKAMATAHGVKLSNVLADEDGVGGGVVDTLKCRGFVNGSRATKPELFLNLKAECYYKLAELIEQNRVTFVGVDELRDEVVKELDMIRRKNVEKDGKLQVTGKDEIKSQHGVSPDIADMIAMRCFFELKPNYGKYSVGFAK
jgi:phage terminase large subunit